MRCPNCDQPTYFPSQPCSNCQFNGDPTLIEELDHIDWVLAEIDTWSKLGVTSFNRGLIQQRYTARQRELEIVLGLRLPPFTPEEARDAWPEFFQHEALRQKMAEWLAASLIDPSTTQTLVDQTTHRIDELLEQLEGHARPADSPTDADRLDTVNFILRAVDYLHQNQSFSAPTAETQILTPLLPEKEQLEINLGLRPAREPVSQQIGEATKGESIEQDKPAFSLTPAPPLPGSPTLPPP
ncbi:MAG: hypothetical protein HYR94_07760, partial [Chloroflexi bacterium]|nr:hypothetical protein [Chloroflexota bacterium]